MNKILEKLKLVDYLTTEIPIERKDFIDRLRKHVDEGDASLFFSPFEVFSLSKNEYKGTVTYDSFRLRRRKRMFEMSTSLATAEGSIRQKENALVIDATIKCLHWIFIPVVIRPYWYT